MRRKAQKQPPEPLETGRGVSGGAAKCKFPGGASSLIPVEALRPLTPGGPGKKRKKCPDCRYCQGCSQDRCRLCRGRGRTGGVKLSLAEQIARYEKLNRPRRRKPASAGGR